MPIDRARLCELSFKVLDGIPDKPQVIPGTLREHPVAGGPYRAPDWSDVPPLVDELVSWLATKGR